MSFRKVHYDTRSSTMHHWYTDPKTGDRKYEAIKWVPHLFVASDKSPITTLEGKPVAKKTFSSYWDYLSFQKENSIGIYENKVKPEIAFLVDRYWQIPDEELYVPDLVIGCLDIENPGDDENGYGSPQNPTAPITLISYKDTADSNLYVWGCRPYTGIDTSFKFIQCKDEKELLRNFIMHFNKNCPDIITGWNVYGYDIPYIINRFKLIFGEDDGGINMLSPVRQVKMWERNGQLNVDIAGVEIIDYYPVYKKFSPKRPENYKLGTISKLELDAGKVAFEEHSLRELEKKDWNKFVEYNAMDTVLPLKLEEKLKYIELIQSLCLMSKCPLKYYEAVTSLIEGLFLTYYRRNNLCAPFHAGGSHEHFEAAFVKDPIVGMHEWIIAMDITSSYPTAMVTLNMGNETFYGCIHDMPEEQVIECNRNREYPDFRLYRQGKFLNISGEALKIFNAGLKKGMFAIAPNGAIFMTNKKGAIAEVERMVFAKRKAAKKAMEATEDKVDRAKLHARQWALKILINSIYGALSVPYYRGFNLHIAAAITAVGRHTIKMGNVHVNEYLNEYFKTKNVDYVAYVDTDSLYIPVGKYVSNPDVNKVVELGYELNNYVNKRAYEETQLIDYCSQEHDFKCKFAFEVVAQSGLWAAKKKYGVWVVWKEGKQKDEIKVTGLEIVKSDSPPIIREALKDILTMILKNKPDDELRAKIKEYKEKFKSLTPAEIATNTACNDLKKYLTPELEIKKGTPHHIKGVINYKRLLKHLKLIKKYGDIGEGEKAKVVYLKPNSFGAESLTFIEWPKEFDQAILIDFDKMIEKSFINKIGLLLEPMNRLNLLNENEIVLNTFF